VNEGVVAPSDWVIYAGTGDGTCPEVRSARRLEPRREFQPLTKHELSERK
jgi:hypothetical protein